MVGSPYYYYPRFYSPFYYYDPFFWGGPYGYGPYGYWQYPYHGPVHFDLTGAARLQVTPKETQIFVDGYFVGTADKFDGTFERLRVEAGEHELEFYLDGYQTVRQPVLFRREGTITIKHVMEPVKPGETSERPTPIEPPQTAESPNPAPSTGIQRAPGGQNAAPPARPAGRFRNARDPRAAGRRGDSDRRRASGTVPEGGSRLSVQLADGPHRVEIRRDGYRPYTANVRIRRGQTETLNVSLTQ